MASPDPGLPRVPAPTVVAAPVLAAALCGGRLEMHYQPVVVLPGRHVVGFEALARVRRPDGVLLPSTVVVSRAERAGLIVALGVAVLRSALAEVAGWRDMSGPIATATVSVNVAPALLCSPGFTDVVRLLLGEHDVPGSALVLEITDATVTSPQIRPVFEQLAQAGVRTALDHVGVGLSPLDILRLLPVHILKLDAGLVAGVTHGGADSAIVRVVIDLAERLGLSVIAQGVETEEQARTLARLGCPAAQGNLFAPPQPDPLAAAQAVVRATTDTIDRDAAPDLWSAEVDCTVLAAARLLTHGIDRHRAAVHAVATDLARRRGFPATSARMTGRLALIHDLARLTIDGGAPASLREQPLLAALTCPTWPRAAPPDAEELSTVRLAVTVADDACRADPDLGPPALRSALDARAGAETEPALAAILRDMAEDPPPVHPMPDLLDDLTRRRLGRRGMEDRVRALVGINRILSSSSDPLSLLTTGLEEVRRIVGAASASLERWERESGRLRTLLNVGQLGPGECAVPADETYALIQYPMARRTLFTGLPCIYTVEDADADAEAVALLARLRKHSTAAVPLHHEGRVWGQLWLTTEPGDPPFQASDVEMLTAVATVMSVVVGQAESLDRMTRLAFSDPLTRVGNRRAVDDALERFAADGRATTVVLIDVDRLKQINDQLGHAAGDRALILVADTLSHELACLPEASVGRLGGDEFCVVAPGCPPGRAQEWVHRVRLLLGESRNAPTVSVGVAGAVAPWRPRDLLAAADADLYAAKRRRGISAEA